MRMDRKVQASININTSGDNTIGSPPGADKFFELDYFYMYNAGADINTITIKDGSTTILPAHPLAPFQGYEFNPSNPSWNTVRFATNSTFTINLAAASDGNIVGFVIYRVVGD